MCDCDLSENSGLSVHTDLSKEGEKVIPTLASTRELNGCNSAYYVAQYALVTGVTRWRYTAAEEITQKSPLQNTRIGTILISAAIIDDVIGLVLSSVIPVLSLTRDERTGDQSEQNITWAIIRPLLSSFLMAVITPLIVRFILKPLFWWRRCGERWCTPRRAGKPWGAGFAFFRAKYLSKSWGTQRHADAVKLVLMIFVVSAFSCIAYCEQTRLSTSSKQILTGAITMISDTRSSVLYGAYLAGLTLTYMSRSPDGHSLRQDISGGAGPAEDPLSFHEAYDRTIGPLQNHILAPLFFASIGYAVVRSLAQ